MDLLNLFGLAKFMILTSLMVTSKIHIVEGLRLEIPAAILRNPLKTRQEKFRGVEPCANTCNLRNKLEINCTHPNVFVILGMLQTMEMCKYIYI